MLWREGACLRTWLSWRVCGGDAYMWKGRQCRLSALSAGAGRVGEVNAVAFLARDKWIRVVGRYNFEFKSDGCCIVQKKAVLVW